LPAGPLAARTGTNRFGSAVPALSRRPPNKRQRSSTKLFGRSVLQQPTCCASKSQDLKKSKIRNSIFHFPIGCSEQLRFLRGWNGEAGLENYAAWRSEKLCGSFEISDFPDFRIFQIVIKEALHSLQLSKHQTTQHSQRSNAQTLKRKAMETLKILKAHFPISHFLILSLTVVQYMY